MSDDGPQVALSVVVPAYNEARRLGATLDRVDEYLRGRLGDDGFELIVVDDGSDDETAAVAARFALARPTVRCLTYRPNRGKGYAVRMGMLAASGRRRLFSDADLSTPIEDLERLEEALDAGADLAIGSRALSDSVLTRRQPFYRELMGRTFNLIARAVGVGHFKDTQCGFKLFSAEAAKHLFSRATVDGFAFDVELLLLAQGRFQVAEVPVHWAHHDASRVSLGADSARMLLELLRVRARLGLGGGREADGVDER